MGFWKVKTRVSSLEVREPDKAGGRGFTNERMLFLECIFKGRKWIL